MLLKQAIRLLKTKEVIKKKKIIKKKTDYDLSVPNILGVWLY